MKKSNNNNIGEAKVVVKSKDLKKVVPQLTDKDIVKVIDDDIDRESKHADKTDMYVEYLSDKSDETSFIIDGKKYEYVWAKYPNGKRDIGVYDFKQDLVLNYEWFRKFILKEKNGDLTKDNAWAKLASVLGVNEKDEHFGPDKNFAPDKLFEEDPTNDNKEIDKEGRNVKKLQQDVKKVMNRLDMSSIQMYFKKIDKPIEQAELLAQFAEKIGVPRIKLPTILKALKSVSESINPKMTKDDLIKAVNENIKKSNNIIKTIKVKDIK